MEHPQKQPVAVTPLRRRSKRCRAFQQSLSLCAAMALCGVWSSRAQDNPSATKACLEFPSPGAGACYPSLSQAEAALGKDPTFGPSFQRAYTESADATGVVIIYHAKDRPAETLYPPSYYEGTQFGLSARELGCPATVIPAAHLSNDLMTPDYACLIQGVEKALSEENPGCSHHFSLAGGDAEPFYSVGRSFNFFDIGTINHSELWHDHYQFIHHHYRCEPPVVPQPLEYDEKHVIYKQQAFRCPSGYIAKDGWSALAAQEQGSNESIEWPNICQSGALARIKVTMQQVASCATAHPCHPATGDKSRAEVDFTFAGRPFTRHYHALGQVWGTSGIGIAWSHPYDMRMAHSTLIDADGTIETFSQINSATIDKTFTIISRGDNTPDRLLRESEKDGIVWIAELRDRDGTRHRFDGLGRLIAIDRPGDVQGSVTLQYSGQTSTDLLNTVTDGLGRVLRFHYTRGHLNQITLPDCQTVNYRQDDDGNLVAVDYGNGQVKQYLYHEAGLATPDQRNLLTGIISEDGRRYASFRYDQQGRAITSVLHDGRSASDGSANAVERTTLNYLSDSTVQVTADGNGTKTYTIQPGVYRRIVGISDSTGSVGYQLSSDGRLSGQTDPRGITTSYGYSDSYRNRQSEAVATADAREITLTRTDDQQLERRELWSKGASPQLRAIQTYRYDNDRRLIAACTLDPAVAVASGYACGSSARPPAGVMQATQTYCGSGQSESNCPLAGLLRTRTTTRGQTWQYQYYASDAEGCGSDPRHCAHRKGDLASVLDGDGQAVLQVGAYDGAGRPLTLSDGNGSATKLAYDGRGRVRQITQQSAMQADRVIQMDYTAPGQLAHWTRPDGQTWQGQYDTALRLTHVDDAANQQISTVLDAASNPVNTAITGPITVPAGAHPPTRSAPSPDNGAQPSPQPPPAAASGRDR